MYYVRISIDGYPIPGGARSEKGYVHHVQISITQLIPHVHKYRIRIIKVITRSFSTPGYESPRPVVAGYLSHATRYPAGTLRPGFTIFGGYQSTEQRREITHWNSLTTLPNSPLRDSCSQWDRKLAPPVAALVRSAITRVANLTRNNRRMTSGSTRSPNGMLVKTQVTVSVKLKASPTSGGSRR